MTNQELNQDKLNNNNNSIALTDEQKEQYLSGLNEIGIFNDNVEKESSLDNYVKNNEYPNYSESFPNYKDSNTSAENLNEDTLNGITNVVQHYHSSETIKMLIDKNGLSNILLKFRNNGVESSLDYNSIKDLLIKHQEEISKLNSQSEIDNFLLNKLDTNLNYKPFGRIGDLSLNEIALKLKDASEPVQKLLKDAYISIDPNLYGIFGVLLMYKAVVKSFDTVIKREIYLVKDDIQRLSPSDKLRHELHIKKSIKIP